MPRELHIASMIVHAKPERLEDLKRQIEKMGLELHLVSPEGKIVVTHETESSGALGDALTRLQLLDDVLSATMVFHHSEPVDGPPAHIPQDNQEVQP